MLLYSCYSYFYIAMSRETVAIQRCVVELWSDPGIFIANQAEAGPQRQQKIGQIK